MKPIRESQYLQLELKFSYYRKLRGLTQEELSEKVELSPAFISHVEAPNVSKAISLFDIAKVLEIPPYKLLYFED